MVLTTLVFSSEEKWLLVEKHDNGSWIVSPYDSFLERIDMGTPLDFYTKKPSTKSLRALFVLFVIVELLRDLETHEDHQHVKRKVEKDNTITWEQVFHDMHPMSGKGVLGDFELRKARRNALRGIVQKEKEKEKEKENEKENQTPISPSIAKFFTRRV